MKSPLAIALICMSSVFHVIANPAPLPQAPIEAKLTVSKPSPFVRETFTLTLEIITRDIEIDPQLDLANLPAHDVMRVTGPFEAMAVKRERRDNQEITRRKYRAQARANKAGNIDLAPLLQLTSRKRVRSFFGSAMEVRPVTLQIPRTKLQVRPIPSPPPAFTGIIGDFTVDMVASPTNIVAGDLVKIKTTLRGMGWVHEDLIPAVSNAPSLRTYSVKEDEEASAKENMYAYTQTVVPTTKKVEAIPAVPFVWFNTKSEVFEEKSFGPFSLSYKPRDQKVEQNVQQESSAVTQTNQTEQHILLRSGNNVTIAVATKVRMAPAKTSKSTFTIAGHSNVRILETDGDWVLIDHVNNRGWVPAGVLHHTQQ